MQTDLKFHGKDEILAANTPKHPAFELHLEIITKCI